MFRAVLKSTTARAVSWTGLDEWVRARWRRAGIPLVLCYHRVVERLNAWNGLALPGMEISVEMLEQHLDWLGRHFRIVALDELAVKLEQSPTPQPLAAVTFDDGYSDIFHHAFPLLKRKGIPAGIFVITDLVGTTELPVHERLHALLVEASQRWTSTGEGLSDVLGRAVVGFSARERLPKSVADPFSATRFLLEYLPQADLRRVMDSLSADEETGPARRLALPPLNWDMLAEMRDAGMTIGSHTKTHAFLANEGEERVLEETDGSRRELEKRLGEEVRCFAYPGGSFNRKVVRAVATAGYRLAFTICRHRSAEHPLLTIPRTGLWEQSCLDPVGRFSSPIMSGQASGAFRWASTCRRAHGGELVN